MAEPQLCRSGLLYKRLGPDDWNIEECPGCSACRGDDIELVRCEGCPTLLDDDRCKRDVEGSPLCDDCWDDAPKVRWDGEEWVNA